MSTMALATFDTVAIHEYGCNVLIRRSCRYRLYPTPEQAERLESWQGPLRFLWNLANEQREMMLARCKTDRRWITAFDQINELAVLRAEYSWLADVPRDVLAQCLVELDAAWQRFFAGLADRPRFKKRERDHAPFIGPNPRSFRIEGAAVVFPKVGAIRAVIHRPLAGKAKRCAIVREGHEWYAAIGCEFEVADPAPSTLPPVGIDRGVVAIVADSTGQTVSNPRHAERARRRIARAQRDVVRRQKGSKNQAKAKAKVARLHRKVRRQRDHVLHQLSHDYTKSHGVIVLERLEIQGMTASAKGTVEKPGVNVRQKAGLNRSILGAGWGRFARMLDYKAVPLGVRVMEVPAQYTSQTCSACGVVDAASRRSQSEFECVACGLHANADVNAARVILARGLRAIADEASVTGCGGRRRPVKQQLRVVRRGQRSEVGHSSLKTPNF